jgi:uncharacterized damage-inducible protein DinB
MITADNLTAMYARNLTFINDLTAGLTHADSLIQPPVSGNCINWVAGHILAYRNRILTILGQPPVFDEVTAARYARDSKPVLGDEPGIGILEDMLQLLDESQAQIAAAMKALSPDDAGQMWTFGQNAMTTAEWMLFLLRHEAYHVGNLELLRQVALSKHTR